jgi:hypothetical protein
MQYKKKYKKGEIEVNRYINVLYCAWLELSSLAIQIHNFDFQIFKIGHPIGN